MLMWLKKNNKNKMKTYIMKTIKEKSNFNLIRKNKKVQDKKCTWFWCLSPCLFSLFANKTKQNRKKINI